MGERIGSEKGPGDRGAGVGEGPGRPLPYCSFPVSNSTLDAAYEKPARLDGAAPAAGTESLVGTGGGASTLDVPGKAADT